uniref:Uncharacterized protein n=1 Tax=Panagrolaimus sp. PS1159 TaxID=55785 RepID=A0AC35G475_9BILA
NFLDDGECYSFPWIVWEGLDAWLCQNDLSSHNENMNHENEICNLVSKNTVYASAFMALQKEHSAYPWFSYFAVMFHSFMVSNDLLPELVSAAVNFYIHTLEEKDVNRSVTIPNDANESFFYFLITIISPNFYHDGPEDENEFIKLYKVCFTFCYSNYNSF